MATRVAILLHTFILYLLEHIWLNNAILNNQDNIILIFLGSTSTLMENCIQ